MSTLSQFFGGATASQADAAKGVITLFNSTRSFTIPSTATFVAYGVMGGGGAGACCFDGGLSCSAFGGGGGGGFSYAEGTISGGPTACVTIGAGGICNASCGCCYGPGGTTSITGISVATICATGGNPTSSSNCGGCGFGGSINTIGGRGSLPCILTGGGGGGAGGVIGNGGCGCNWQCGSGGGFGGGGGAGSGCGTGGAGAPMSTAYAGGPGLVGQGGVGGIASSVSYQSIGVAPTPATSGYIPQYTNTGCLSQGKTYFAAAGGGGGVAMGCNLSCVVAYLAAPAAAGGGGAYAGAAGFGGGSATLGTPGIGGGAAYGTCTAGSGFAIIEYWN